MRRRVIPATQIVQVCSSSPVPLTFWMLSVATAKDCPTTSSRRKKIIHLGRQAQSPERCPALMQPFRLWRVRQHF